MICCRLKDGMRLCAENATADIPLMSVVGCWAAASESLRGAPWAEVGQVGAPYLRIQERPSRSQPSTSLLVRRLAWL
jgi:hypothetical protein